MMPEGWRQTTIGEVITLQRGFDITRAEQHPGQVPVISSGGVSSWHDRPMAKGPGVIIGRKGTLGRTYYVTTDYWPHDTTLWVRDFKGNDPRFVYYFLSALSVLHLDVGSANPTLNRNHVHPIRTLWPPVEEQRRIAGVLGALDDLIDVNRKLAHCDQSLAAALASGSLDRVPLSDLAAVADVRQLRPDGPVDHFSIPAFDEGQLPARVNGESIKSGKLLLEEPVVLVSRLNPQTPRVWMAYPSDVPAVASTEFVPLLGADSVAVEEIWAVCAADEFAAQMMVRVTGTTGSHQRVDKAAIPQLLVADVRKLDPRERTAIISLVREASASLASVSEAAQTRDELLPVLLSGLVRVGEVAA